MTKKIIKLEGDVKMKTTRWWFLTIIIGLMVVLSGCGKQEGIEELSLIQNYANHTPQEQAFYNLKKGKLTIIKKYNALSNPTAEDFSEKQEEHLEKVEEMFHAEFPTETKDLVGEKEEYQIEISNAKAEETDSGILLTGKDYKWEFTFMGESKSRVTDQFGVEYEVHREEK